MLEGEEGPGGISSTYTYQLLKHSSAISCEESTALQQKSCKPKANSSCDIFCVFLFLQPILVLLG